jgi:peptidoglycan/xylan/chitin deacetylase (PgdA/CDA1 family)
MDLSVRVFRVRSTWRGVAKPDSYPQARNVALSTNHLLRAAFDSTALSTLMGCFERTESRRANLLRVLTYHRVFDVSAFRGSMEYLAQRYHFVTANELLEVLRDDKRLPPRSMMITFDDAYSDFATTAWPVLRSYNIPVVLFVPTGYPGNGDQVFWWDRLEQAIMHTPRGDALETPAGCLRLHSTANRRRVHVRLRALVKTWDHDRTLSYVDEVCEELGGGPCTSQVLSWDALRSLARDGVTLASHTRMHPLLNRVSTETARAEIAGAREDLLRETGTSLPLFAYPGGYYCPQTRKVLSEAGIEAAFTTVRGTNDLGSEDHLRLRRINIGHYANAGVVRARLLESAVSFNRWRPVPDTYG